ncbi:MAG TPA: hypothetical protein VIK02_01140 [Candidatus Anoxymicrobiaceae bacterium]
MPLAGATSGASVSAVPLSSTLVPAGPAAFPACAALTVRAPSIAFDLPWVRVNTKTATSKKASPATPAPMINQCV